MEDEIGIVTKETDDKVINVKTQILDEPETLVILIYRSILDKKTGRSSTKKVYREVIKK